MSRAPGFYPEGLKVGDFIQSVDHFNDIFFEVVSTWAPDDRGYWMITFIKYSKYGVTPTTEWINSATSVRRVIPAEMAIPVMLQKRLRFAASWGQYDPIFGFAPAGKALRNKDAW